MYRLVFTILVLSAACYCNDLNDTKGSAREEKFRSALIDAFQNIKKSSAKGGIEDSDLIGSISNSRNAKVNDDSFDLFADEDGLTFNEGATTDKPISTTQKSHNVQHIKTIKIEKSTIVPKDVVEVPTSNERSIPMRLEQNETHLLGLESMLRVIDAPILVAQWNRLRENVTGQCREDMQEYIEGLKDRLLWALKSEFVYKLLVSLIDHLLFD
ncbi:unnamed protein product [Pieris macdunnoughi]|uniref:Uncharacterized protein n=1 Tax=Pieris macdunnoughi TaxID=345717 RepID=A0A821R5Z7_9NEOP|nr:unnamed protein product [Pieris macdunnoughi]